MDVLYRHKNKIVFSAVAVAALYGGVKYIRRALQRRVFAPPPVPRMFGGGEMAQGAVINILPTLSQNVKQLLDTELLTKQLMTKPSNKMALWEELKSLSFARLVAGVYCCTLLSTFMSVQLSILGGMMAHSDSSSVHEEYRAQIEDLLNQGVRLLCEAVQTTAADTMRRYTLKQSLSSRGVEQLVKDVRDHTPSLLDVSHYSLTRESSDSLSIAMRDIVESPQFKTVFQGCLERAFTMALSSLTTTYHSAAQSDSTIPLARLVPMVTDHAQLILSNNDVVKVVLNDANLQTLSENIYEAFSQ